MGWTTKFRLHSCCDIDRHIQLIRSSYSHWKLLGMASELTSSIAHLYRRAGFGITIEQADALAPAGYAAAVEQLLDRSKPDDGVAGLPDPQIVLLGYQPNETLLDRKAKQQIRVSQRNELELWWLQRMMLAQKPLPEKLALFWHGHFATSSDKVREAAFMFQQNQTFRSLGAGKFEPLAQAIAKDPAMMLWLDSNRNKKGSPNENFARELMELFTIGIGNYSDADVREAARAFTGWRISREGVFSILNAQADRGTKSILGRAEAFSGEQVVSLLATNPAAAKFVTSKIWSRFAYPVATDSPIVAELSGPFGADGDITKLMRSVFMHPEFISSTAKRGLVKQPIEYVVGAMRVVGMKPLDTPILGGNPRPHLVAMNQVPFDPPSVGGWPQNNYWLSTATSLARIRFAIAVSRLGDKSWLTGTTPEQRADQLAQRLGVDGWSSSTRRALVIAKSPQEQLTAAFVSPEYVLN
jgi:uncharacterized protein (DUF1800 family)